MLNNNSKNKKLLKLSDEKLMELFVSDGNRRAYSVLYQRYFNSIAKYIGWVANDMDLGKDVVQHVFSKLYDSPRSFDLNKKFRTWIYIVAKNKLNNEWRDKNNREKILNEYSFLNDISDVSKDEDMRIKKITAGLEQLSEEHKNTFVLKYSSNFTIKEISEVYNCSEGTVKSRLFYAIKQLKEIVNN